MGNGNAKSDKLTPEEQQRMLRILKEYAKTPKEGSPADREREQRELRESRRKGWRPGAR